MRAHGKHWGVRNLDLPKGVRTMKENIRRFKAWTRKNRERIETPFNWCFERCLPPKEQRTSFWVAAMMTGAVGLGLILGVAYAEIKEIHNDQKAVQIWVDDSA